jgi:hypothetical protein
MNLDLEWNIATLFSLDVFAFTFLIELFKIFCTVRIIFIELFTRLHLFPFKVSRKFKKKTQFLKFKAHE